MDTNNLRYPSPDSPEEWRWVDGSQGDYEIGSTGMLRSYKYGDARLLRGNIDRDGYRIYSMRINGRYVVRRAHRLVMEAFVGSAPEMLVLHYDGDPSNNDIRNLRYGNHAENSQDTIRHGRTTGFRTHCAAGHEYTTENTLVGAKGRRCRQCATKRRAKKRAELPEGAPQHGTESGYGYWRCRCEVCTVGHRVRCRERKRRKREANRLD